MPSRRLACLAVALAIAPAAAHAEEGGGPHERRWAATSNRLNVRLGGATTDTTSRPTICVDVRVVSGFGVETCGTGQGIIHDEPGRQMAHFRATWTALARATERGVGKLRIGAGIAELQLDADRPGFNFGRPGRDQSVAGPQAVVQGQWLIPLAGGTEVVTSVTAGVAAFAEADQLVIPQRNVMPFVSFEIGLGW
jgi:hypothetical protein